MKLATLRKRAEFLRVRGGARCPTPPFVLEAKPRPAETCAAHKAHGPRFGFTVTKAVGNAVQRNRIRRRLKAAVTEVAAHAARRDLDYVVIARAAALDRPYDTLKKDLERAFHRVHHPPHASPRSDRTPTRR